MVDSLQVIDKIQPVQPHPLSKPDSLSTNSNELNSVQQQPSVIRTG